MLQPLFDIRSLTKATRLMFLVFVGSIVIPSDLPAEQPADEPDLARALQSVSPNVLSENERANAAEMIGRDIRRRSNQVNADDRANWSNVKSRQDWEDFRDVRLKRLRDSLGAFPPPPKELNVRQTGTVRGEGFQIENLIYESRPGQWVSANLYAPAKPTSSMPGILIAHAHHRPKRQGELQDMGMTWARAGCLVLAIDQVGYGERRAHPFHTEEDYSKPYRLSRQDYFFRYDSGIQLQLAGDSLMGWMVWDLMRGVDLLVNRPGVDPRRIILLGAVAGGGDPCAVTAALDQRVTAAVPFNFGGPQPETRYPLPEDAETSFNYLGGSYWDSTRGLRRGGVDGFLHWVIVGGIAPRRLIYGHEFSWDRPQDPVWRRLRKIYDEFYRQPDHLGFAHGKGLLKQRPPQSSHCTNIGAYHRRMIHPLLAKWFGIQVEANDEYSRRRDPEELICFTSDARRDVQPMSLPELVSELGQQRAAAARKRLHELPLDERRKRLADSWRRLLGDIEPRPVRVVSGPKTEKAGAGSISVERVVLEVETGFNVPLLLIQPPNGKTPRPAVLAVSQAGKSAFLSRRAEQIAEILSRGAVVCLPDLRGTGETKAGESRGRASGDGNRSVNLLLFGETMIGRRLYDMRCTLEYLKQRSDIDAKRITLWGDSFAPANDPKTNFQVPRDVAGRPSQSEPLGGMLALLGALFDEEIHSVYIHGGLSGFLSVLSTPYVLIPHDVVVPQVLTTGDLCDIAATIAPRRLRLEGFVDGLNRKLSIDAVRETYQGAVRSYENAGAKSHFSIGASSSSIANWLAHP